MRAIVTKKVYDEDKKEYHYYFRNLYGMSWKETERIDRYQSIDFDVPGTDVCSSDEYEIGDYVEYFKRSDGVYRFKKITPTEEDIKTREVFEKYIEAASTNFGLFFKDVLEFGREKVVEECERSFTPYLYSDEEINLLVYELVDAIKTYGVPQGQVGGLATFWYFLKRQNVFRKEPVDYFEVLGWLGVDDDEYPYNLRRGVSGWDEYKKMTVPRKYSSILFYNGQYFDSYISGFDMGIPGCDFSASLWASDLELDVTPYKPGSFREAIEDLEKENYFRR